MCFVILQLPVKHVAESQNKLDRQSERQGQLHAGRDRESLHHAAEDNWHAAVTTADDECIASTGEHLRARTPRCSPKTDKVQLMISVTQFAHEQFIETMDERENCNIRMQ